MFTSDQYRAKAVEYGKLLETAGRPGERRELHALKERFTVLADDEQWLADNRHAARGQTDGAALAREEDKMLRCLGAALILQWNTLPQKLRRELFDKAGSMGDLERDGYREKLARLLHTHKNDGGAIG